MAFIRLRGVPGVVYVPDADQGGPKKHPCADCFSCGWCSDERCVLCLTRGKRSAARRRTRRQAGGCPRRCGGM